MKKGVSSVAMMRDGKGSVGTHTAPHTTIASHGFIDGSRSHDCRTIHGTVSDVEVLEIDVLGENTVHPPHTSQKRGDDSDQHLQQVCSPQKPSLLHSHHCFGMFQTCLEQCQNLRQGT